MQQLREILRQKLALKRSHRQVATCLGISPSTVADVSSDARSLGLDGRDRGADGRRARGATLPEDATK